MLRGLGNKMRFWKRREDEEATPPSRNDEATKKQQVPTNKSEPAAKKETAAQEQQQNTKQNDVILKEDHDEIEIGTDNDAKSNKNENVKHAEEQPNKKVAEEVRVPESKSPHKKKQKMQTISDADKVLVEGQHDREIKAEQEGLYVKNQRVKYHHRATDTYYDNAVICGVHFDDGPDKPYYTIKYVKKLDDGTEEPMEKQTTPDRLERVPWDEKATWAIMKKKKK